MAALAGGALVTCCRLLAILALVAAFLVFLFGAFNGVCSFCQRLEERILTRGGA